ncbi:MAG TPA: hypothetical protein VLB84_08410, partial [Bacteroidia bacterium]|nr:hypothetical protein [Bacteroidia bacterium]
MHNTIRIVPYRPEYAIYFERFNKAWLEEYFEVEPIDKYVLENPEEAILKPGGRILFAECEGKILGTVALKPVENGLEAQRAAPDSPASRATRSSRLMVRARCSIRRTWLAEAEAGA